MQTILEKYPGIGSQSFKRNQIEWALWRAFRKLGQTAPEPVSQFTTSIKRLLDLDRRIEMPQGVDDPSFARYAYGERPPLGKGSDAEYLAADAFCLAVGLDLLDIGINQKDAVFLGRGVRHRLLATFEKMLEGPERDSRQAGNPNNYPCFPTYEPLPSRARSRRRNTPANRTRHVDFATYLLVRRSELTGTLPDGTQKSLPAGIPIFLEPDICEGSEELGRFLADLRLKERKAIVVELGFSATNLCRWLSQAPVITRGQPKL